MLRRQGRNPENRGDGPDRLAGGKPERGANGPPPPLTERRPAISAKFGPGLTRARRKAAQKAARSGRSSMEGMLEQLRPGGIT
jgi:hypothetical protein